MKRSGELRRKTRLSPIGKKRRLATGSRGPSFVPPPRVHTYLEVDGVEARVTGDLPLTPKSEAAVRDIVRTAGAMLRAIPKAPPPIRSEAFLSLVRTKPCICCGAPAPSDPDHVGPRGMGPKTDDVRCVPACRWCHTFRTRNGYFPWNGRDTVVIARAKPRELWLLKMQTRVHVAEAQRELLIEYLHELGEGRAA